MIAARNDCFLRHNRGGGGSASQLFSATIRAVALVEVEREGLAEVIPTARVARLTMNRASIRQLAAETLKLPTTPYRFADSLTKLQAAIDSGIGYPCVVKPIMSSSGKGKPAAMYKSALS